MIDPYDVLNLSSAIVPRIFENTAHLIGNRVYFTGRGTYDVDDLISLLPEGVSSGEMDSDPPDDYGNPATLIVVVGEFDDVNEFEIARYVVHMRQKVMFLPQEDFLDLVLFGYDWWGDVSYHGLLNYRLHTNPGLAFAKSLSEQDQFQWPSTEVAESEGGNKSDQTFSQTSWLYDIGYNVTNVSESRRHQILRIPVDFKGLEATASLIASHIRIRAIQFDGRNKFWRAIEKWEGDLSWLKDTFHNQITFEWPETGSD